MHRYLANRKLVAGLGLVAVLLVVGLWPRALPVDVAQVARGPLVVTVAHEGKTRIHERFVVSAPVAGRVLRIELEPGDVVKKGDTLLATFRPSTPGLLDARTRAEAEARVAAAAADLEQARAAAAGAAAQGQLARAEAQRQRELASQRIGSQQALDMAEAGARSAEEARRAAEFAVRSAEHGLEMARAQLLQAREVARSGGVILPIHSPIDGVVLTRAQQSEAIVPAGAPLLELGAPHDLEIVADFLSSDAVKVNPGARVLVEQWGGDQSLTGRVRRVEPSGYLKISALGVEEQRVNVIVDFADPLEAWKRLGDGFRVEVEVVIWERPDVLKVPTGALFRRGGDWSVFTVERGRARLRKVEIGKRNGLEAEVISGLQADRKVIVHPGDAVGDGARVSARLVPAAALS
jgi:HlyD family secretion protein